MLWFRISPSIQTLPLSTPKSIILVNGSLIFAFEGESFSVTATAGEEYLYIDFSGGRADMLFRRLGINAGNRTFDGFDGLIPLWHESLIRASHDNIDLAAESVLLYSMSRINTTCNEQNTLVQQIIDITEENFSNKRAGKGRSRRKAKEGCSEGYTSSPITA